MAVNGVTKERITSSSATMTQANLHGGTSATKAARNGFAAGDDAGHIFGKLLGGKGGASSDNIFPQLSKVNRGVYAKAEQQLARELKNGKTVAAKVDFFTMIRISQNVLHGCFTHGV